MNEYDSDRILDSLKKINYTSTKNIEDANCYILNTCHIREKATDKVYHDIGRVKKKFKNKKKPIVIVAGCVAQAEGDILLKKEKYIDALIGPQSYHRFNKILLDIEKNNKTLLIILKTLYKLRHTYQTMSCINNFFHRTFMLCLITELI